MRRLLLFIVVFGIAFFSKGQDPHCKGVEAMRLWYNPALKTDTTSYAHVQLHKVNYPGILSTASKSITIELVFERNMETVSPTVPFFTLTAGLNVDNASDNLMKASSAMLGLSYALPLDYNNTYMAIGFQGNYSFNQVGNAGYSLDLPEKFDQFGALNWAIKRDPLKSGYNFGYFTFNAGAAVFHNQEERQWYIGASTRYINHPYTEWDHVSALPTTFGFQGGYTAAINETTEISGYGNISWQSGSTTSSPEQYLGIRGIRKIEIDDSTSFKLSVGLGVSFHQALQPNIQLQKGRHLLAGYLDLNFAGIASSGYNRRAYAILYRYEL